MASLNNLILYYLYASCGCLERPDIDINSWRKEINVVSWTFASVVMLQTLIWLLMQFAAFVKLRGKSVPVL
jgi:hypothetical protein